jgi:hypothetical protein
VGNNSIGQTYQGSSVSLAHYGYGLAIGGQFDNGGVGAVWIFIFDGTSWSQQAKLVASDPNGESNQGVSVSLSENGNTLAVGGYGDDSFVGATWIWTRTWSQTEGT